MDFTGGLYAGYAHPHQSDADCIVTTTQNTRELWGCAEDLSILNFNKKKMNQWIKDFPGALYDTGDIPTIRRDRYVCLVRSEDD